MSPTRTSLAAAAGLVAILAAPPAAVLAGTDGGDDGTIGSVVVEDAGDPATAVAFPPTPEVGHQSSTTMDMQVSFAMSGGGVDLTMPVGLRLDMSGSVTEVLPDGGYVAVQSIDQVTITEAPEGVDEGVPCASADGLELQTTFDARGQTVAMEPLAEELTPADAECAASLAEDTSTVEVIYPDEPIGVGARWSATIDVESEGIELPVTYDYTLTDIAADGTYTVDVSFDEAIDTDVEGAPVTGTMSGGGTLTGSMSNPLDVAATMEANVEMGAEIEGDEFNVIIEILLEITSKSTG